MAACQKGSIEFQGWREISWVRRRDWHILTSGMFTYTNDERFQVLHAEGSDDWTLQIKYVQKRDNGTYECQIKYKQKRNNGTYECQMS
uniref:Ig-like domain-containing protein n=1 Tax=Timema shepardi TaxID=629360 RepID=A0A7R9AKB6_TIMSH|nr:unnamed protein product [Timema shepardi]